MKLFKNKEITKTYDRETMKPVLKCSICTGEQVAGFQNIHTGKFEDVMLVRNENDLKSFKKQYGIEEEITKIY
ncbi:MAG: aspartate dehydrogenase [Lachnospiraceae bacterium]|nr:aspartate dehydrogenase [Lachnospiraceae bacterium]